MTAAQYGNMNLLHVGIRHQKLHNIILYIMHPFCEFYSLNTYIPILLSCIYLPELKNVPVLHPDDIFAQYIYCSTVPITVHFSYYFVFDFLYIIYDVHNNIINIGIQKLSVIDIRYMLTCYIILCILGSHIYRFYKMYSIGMRNFRKKRIYMYIRKMIIFVQVF